MYVLCTGSNCVAKENAPLTMWRWTDKNCTFFYLLACLILSVANTQCFMLCPIGAS